MKKLFNNKYIVAFIMAFISYLSFLIYFKDIFSNDSFNLMYTLLFFFLYYFYYVELGRSKNKLGKIEKNSIILVSFILSFCLVVGSIVSSYLGDIAGTIFNFHNILYCFVGIVGYMLFFYFVIRKFVSLTNKLKIKGKGNFGGKDFFKFVLLFLLAWLPYFLRYFPAVMTPDSYYSIENVSNFILSDYHTFGHTWFFGAFFLLGKLLFGNLNLAVGFYIVIQMIIKNIERDKYTSIIHEELNKLGVEFSRYKERWDKLAKSIQTVNKDVENVYITTEKITKKFDYINQVDVDKLEEKKDE